MKSVHDLMHEFEYPAEYSSLGYSSASGTFVNKERLLEAEKRIAELKVTTENYRAKLLDLSRRILRGSDDDAYWATDISDVRKLAFACIKEARKALEGNEET